MGAGNHLVPINLGNPAEKTLLELSEVVTRIVGGSGDLVFLPLPEDDPRVRKPDISRATNLLNWRPEIPLEIGIEKTADWMKKVLVQSVK
jgi:nucleoside-diphosphate-sugar epimerase